MKIKYLISILLIVLVFSFGCTAPKATTIINESEIKEIKVQLENIKMDISNMKKDIINLANNSSNSNDVQTKLQKLNDGMYGIDLRLSGVENRLNKIENSSVATTETNTVETTIAEHQQFKDQLINIIESDFEGKLTKLTFSDDGLILYLAYNTKWFVDETIKKEIYNITTIIAENNSNLNTDVKATSEMGKSIHAYTSTENMIKIKNLEMSYDDWLKVAFK